MMKLFHGAKHPGRPIDWEARVSAALTAGCLMVAIGIIASAVRAQTITSCVNTKSGAVSVISKGSCPKNTNPVVLNPTSVQTLTVKTLEVVDSNNHTVATLGKDSNGDLLTFFDSKGKRTLTLGNDATETFAGLETFDGNNIIMGDGIARTAFGEIAGADPLLNNPKLQSFGERSFDSSGSLRSFSELVLGLTADGDSVFNANVTTGKLFPTQIEFGASKSQNFAGFDIVDSTGFARQDVNLSLDGTMNSWAESDTNGVNRVLAQQADERWQWVLYLR